MAKRAFFFNILGSGADAENVIMSALVWTMSRKSLPVWKSLIADLRNAKQGVRDTIAMQQARTQFEFWSVSECQSLIVTVSANTYSLVGAEGCLGWGLLQNV